MYKTKQRYTITTPAPPPQAKKRKKEIKEKKGRKGKERNQIQHILFLGKFITAMPLKDEQPICH